MTLTLLSPPCLFTVVGGAMLSAEVLGLIAAYRIDAVAFRNAKYSRFVMINSYWMKLKLLSKMDDLSLPPELVRRLVRIQIAMGLAVWAMMPVILIAMWLLPGACIATGGMCCAR